MSPRTLVMAAPTAAAVFLLLGAPCAQSAHPFFFYAGVVHADAGCESGAALGPSALQMVGVIALILVTAAVNSALVRDVVDAIIDRLAPQRAAVHIPASRPVSSAYRGMVAHGGGRTTSSRDPPSV